MLYWKLSYGLTILSFPYVHFLQTENWSKYSGKLLFRAKEHIPSSHPKSLWSCLAPTPASVALRARPLSPTSISYTREGRGKGLWDVVALLATLARDKTEPQTALSTSSLTIPSPHCKVLTRCLLQRISWE